MKKIIIFWEQMPVCGLLLNELNVNDCTVIIYATRPKVPFDDLQKYMNYKITWIDHDVSNDVPVINNNIDIFIHSGWGFSGFVKNFIKANHRYIKKRVLLMDNIDINFSLKRFFGKFIFKHYLHKFYDAIIVPGVLSYNYALSLGFSLSQIYTGYYGASSKLFNSKHGHQENNFLFIGQKIKRKGIDTLLMAYKIYREDGGSWGMILAGSGQLPEYLLDIKVDGLTELTFQQPYDASILMRESKCLVLPSYEDHWGTVACEAAACGLPLLLSTQVGDCPDILINGGNGYMYEPADYEGLAKFMKTVSSWSDTKQNEASQISKELAERFNGLSLNWSIKSILEI